MKHNSKLYLMRDVVQRDNVNYKLIAEHKLLLLAKTINSTT